MRARSLIAGLAVGLLGASPGFCATGGQGSQGGGVFAVYDRAGNALTVSNRIDGGRSYIQIASYGRNQMLNWNRTHSDGYNERVTAIQVDMEGNLFIVGARAWQGQRYLWVMKYSSNGDLTWERADVEDGCVAFNVVSSENGDAWVAGSCIEGSRYPIRVMRVNGYGNVFWARSYDEGGRNYVRGLAVDYIERAAVTVEVSAMTGGYVRTIVFGADGGRVASY